MNDHASALRSAAATIATTPSMRGAEFNQAAGREEGVLSTAVALQLYLVASVIVTWPLALHCTTHLPLGTLGTPTVSWFNLWTLEWNALRIRDGFAGYWDAPIFFPARAAFALSEPQGFTGIFFALLELPLGPVASYNVLLLLTLALNGIGARHLLRTSGVASTAATLGGVLVVASPYAIKELGVLQLLALYPPLFVLAELCKLQRGEGGVVWIRLALWWSVTLWTCVYYALFLSLFLVLGLLAAIGKRRMAFKPGKYVFLALVVGGACAAPLLLAQHRAVNRYQRSAQMVRSGSADVSAYVQLDAAALGARVHPLPTRPPGKFALYPGSALLALAAVGLWRQRRGVHASWVRFCAAACGLAFVLSLGTRWSIAGVVPYERLVQDVLPGFAQLRSPYRFAAFLQVFLVAIAGFGVEEVLRRTRDWRLGRLIPCVLALCLLENVTLAERLHEFPAEELNAAWVRWLEERPGGSIAMIPPQHTGRASDFEPVTLSMLQSLVHGHPLVGGFSGFFPPSAEIMADRLWDFPHPSLLDFLRQTGVRYVVVDASWAEERGVRAPADTVLVHASGGKLVYALESVSGLKP
jgi:hypothetical protein